MEVEKPAAVREKSHGKPTLDPARINPPVSMRMADRLLQHSRQ